MKLTKCVLHSWGGREKALAAKGAEAGKTAAETGA